MIDTHCHLDVAAFDGDRQASLARAAAAGVSTLIVPGIRPATWSALAALGTAPSIVTLKVALGVHPQVVPDLTAAERLTVDQLATLAVAAGAVAIGECGLDGATADKEEQERLLRLHVRVAREVGLPLILHVLGAHHLAPRLLEEERVGDVGGVLHSYSGGQALVTRYARLGLAFSFAGPVSYANARRPVESARVVPRELLLVETDAPDQTPAPHRGRRCEPADLPHVVAALARARGEETADVAALTAANAVRIFRLPAESERPYTPDGP